MSVDNIRGILSIAFVFFLIVGAAFISNACQLVSYLIIRPFSLAIHRKVCVVFSGAFLLCSVFLLEIWAGVTFKSYGDKIAPSGSYLTVVNHCSDVDWLLGLAYVARFGHPYPGNAKSVVKASLGKVPLFGSILHFSEFLFLTRNWAADRDRFLAALASLHGYARCGAPIWFVLYPEGTRITEEKLKYSQAYASEKNLPELNHVLFPRFKAFTAIVSTLRNDFDGIVDATFMYEGETPSMKRTLAGRASTVVHVHKNYVPMCDVPEGEEQLEQWLLDRWYEKDRRIAEFKKDISCLGPAGVGHFPTSGKPSVLPLYVLMAAFVFSALATVYKCAQVKNGLYILLAVNVLAFTMTGIFTIMNLRPSRKGSGTSRRQ